MNKIMAAVIAAGAVAAWYAWRRAPAGSFDPTSRNNLAYRAANSVVQVLTGDPNQTVGGLAHDATHPRAGLADNEVAIAPGVFMTLPRATADGASTEQAWGAFIAGENPNTAQAAGSNPDDPLAYGYKFH